MPPIQSTNPMFAKSSSGRLSISYDSSSFETKALLCFPTQFFFSPAHEEAQKEIYGFTPNGETINLLQPHDPSNPRCRSVSWSEQADPFCPQNWQRLARRQRSPSKKKPIDTQRRFWQHYKSGILGYDILGDPYEKFDYDAYYGKKDSLTDTSHYLPFLGWNNNSSDSNDDDSSTRQPMHNFIKAIPKSKPKKKCSWQWKPKTPTHHKQLHQPQTSWCFSKLIFHLWNKQQIQCSEMLMFGKSNIPKLLNLIGYSKRSIPLNQFLIGNRIMLWPKIKFSIIYNILLKELRKNWILILTLCLNQSMHFV